MGVLDGMVIVEGEGAVLGVNLGRPIVINGALATRSSQIWGLVRHVARLYVCLCLCVSLCLSVLLVTTVSPAKRLNRSEPHTVLDGKYDW